MRKQIKVFLFGLGSMGQEIAKLILQKEELIIAGVIEKNENVGRDLGEVLGFSALGIPVSASIREVLGEKESGVLVHVAARTLKDTFIQIMPAIKAGLNVISLSEEISYPWKSDPDIAAEIDNNAKRNSVSVLGTGLNPGFAMDVFPISLLRLCQKVRSIHVNRVTSWRSSETALQQIGFNLTPEEFQQKMNSGGKQGYRGILCSLEMITAALGCETGLIDEKYEPILSETIRDIGGTEIDRGKIIGFRKTAGTITNNGTEILLELVGIVNLDSSLDQLEAGTYAYINGEPSIEATLKGSITMESKLAIASIPVNSIKHVLEARPGLISADELPSGMFIN